MLNTKKRCGIGCCLLFGEAWFCIFSEKLLTSISHCDILDISQCDIVFSGGVL